MLAVNGISSPVHNISLTSSLEVNLYFQLRSVSNVLFDSQNCSPRERFLLGDPTPTRKWPDDKRRCLARAFAPHTQSPARGFTELEGRKLQFERLNLESSTTTATLIRRVSSILKHQARKQGSKPQNRGASPANYCGELESN